MRLVAYDLKNLENPNMTKSKNQALIEEFMASDMTCAKVEGFTQKTAISCANSLNISIKRFNFGGVRAISRRNEAFLIKTNE